MHHTTLGKLNMRERVLHSACQLFAKHGYRKVGIREIAEQSQVNPGTVIYHFKTKEQLYGDVFYRALNVEAALSIDDLLDREPRLLDSDEGKAYAIQQIVFDFFHRHLHAPGSWRRQLILREIFEPSEIFKRLIDTVLTIEVAKMERFFYMLKPEASPEEAYHWTHLPDAQVLYYLISGPVIGDYLGEDFVKTLFLKITRSTTEMMILLLDLPVPRYLKE